MKSDINRLMHELNLDAIIVLGDETANREREYMTNRAKARGIVIQKRDEEPVIIVNGMEIDEAAKSGLKVLNWADFGMYETRTKYKDNPIAGTNELYNNVFKKLGISGRVALFGTMEISSFSSLMLHLLDNTMGIELVTGNYDVSKLFQTAYETKSPEEIAALKEAGKLTSEVVRRTWNFISSHRAEGDAVGSRVVDKDGKPLTIGDVKRFIRLQQLELGLDDAEGCIFSQGRDSAIPHSTGENDEVLQVGKTIVFDIFPTGTDSGYYHDMTRTWCIGHAPVDVQTVYDDVFTIFKSVCKALKVGQKTSIYQLMTLDYFEGKGHPTQRVRPGTLDGYVHGLGHGIGLNVHEAPFFSEHSSYKLAPGNVITVEPGLYYPDKGLGVRIEDSIYLDENGTPQTLTDFPYDLVLPLKG